MVEKASSSKLEKISKLKSKDIILFFNALLLLLNSHQGVCALSENKLSVQNLQAEFYETHCEVYPI